MRAILISFAFLSLSAFSGTFSFSAAQVTVAESPDSVRLKSKNVDETLPLTKCSRPSFESFKKKIITLNSETYPYTQAGAIDVTIEGQKKKISRGSLLGRYLDNIDVHILSLKSEIRLACKI
jgi:hypothetical protein